MRSYLVPVYATYLVATVGLCVWLARTLFRNGEVFLADVFEDRPDVARSVNRLLVTGFAMFELGFGLVLLGGGAATNAAEALEILTNKLGGLLVSLAVVHFANILVFHWISDRRRRADRPTPVAQQPWGYGFGPPPPAPPAGAAITPPPPAPAVRPNPPVAAPYPTGG